eukprot:599876-Prymnesium_polylepis.2
MSQRHWTNRTVPSEFLQGPSAGSGMAASVQPHTDQTPEWSSRLSVARPEVAACARSTGERASE